LTFDDGGIGALKAADMLELFNWRGHFFIATDYIGKNSFLSQEHIRELRKRGHVIGSHSCSHPKRMADYAPSRLVGEWKESIRKLEDILGEKVAVASVPGGFYSKAVARNASLAGIRCLFTSEATNKPYVVDGCSVLGRFVVRRGTPPEKALAFATGNRFQCETEKVTWSLKKISRFLGGALYENVRTLLLERASKQ
jgi:peptidoglycan/xylan/chitin deacetylase (PgdA/CDA1 family)